MQYSLFTLRRKANEAGYSFQKGYQILDYRSNCLVYPSNNDIHDHAMGLDEAVALLKDLCAERGVTF